MLTRLTSLALVPLALALTPPVATAEVFKWAEADGSVHYGDSPPAQGRNVRVLPKNAGYLSVIPGMSKEEKERLREREDQLRLQRLEREVEELRARELARENAQPEIVYADGYFPAYGYALPFGHRRPLVSRDHRGDHPREKWSGKPGPDIPRPKPRLSQPLQEANVTRAPVGAFSRRW